MVYKAIKANLIDAMGGRATPFAVLTLNEGESASTVFAGHVGAVSPQRAAVDAALDYIGVARGAHRRIRTDDLNHDTLWAAAQPGACIGPYWGDQLVWVLLAQLYNTQQCSELMQVIEAEIGAPFEYVVHLRPDATWVQPMPMILGAPESTYPPWAVLSSSGRWDGVGDWAAMGPRELMLAWFSRLDWAAHACEGSWRKLDRVLPVGEGLEDHFGEVGVGFERREMPIVIVRGNRDERQAANACQCKDTWFDAGGGQVCDGANMWLSAPAHACLDALYNEGGAPRHAQHGAWW